MQKTVLLMLLPLIFSIGCKDRKKNPVAQVQEASKDRDLQKTWQSECVTKPLDAALTGIMSGGQASIKSTRTLYSFTGANVTRTTHAYAQLGCAQEAYTFQERGSFKIHDQKTNDGGRAIDMEFDKVFVKISDDAGATAANAIRMCRRGDWAKGQEVEVTSVADDALCYNAKVPRKNANAYRIDNRNTLLLGNSGLGDTASQSRPASVTTGTKFSAK